MDQDPVESFIKNKQKFSLSLLLSAHSKLSVQQLMKGCVTQEDTQLSLRAPISGQQLTSAELNAHAGLLFESIITPSISATGQVKLQVNKDVLGNDEAFIGAILGVVQNKCAGIEYPLVEEFKRESIAYLRQLNAPLKPAEPEPITSFEGVSVPVQDFVTQPVALPKPPVAKAPSPATSLSPPVLSQQVVQQAQFQAPQQAAQQAISAAPVEYDGPEEHKYAPARLEFERAEPIVRLLAQLRKVGMDILFPQSTHDKILAIIFVAVKSFATPAHRELIDMVMTVKESTKVSQLEPVSKTKIRGVLALLKHGELLVTQGDYGEPVRLYLAPGIETFKDLRERHDSFLSMYMLDHHLFIPAMLRTELVWQLDEETRLMRLDAMDKLVFKLKHFFGGLAEYSANAIDRDGSDTAGASPESATAASKAPQAAGSFSQAQAQGYGGRGGRGGGKFDVNGMPGRGGNMGGRGYPPYSGGAPGGRGGRFGQYGPYGGHFNASGGYDGGYGYGGGGGGYGGRYTSYATSRAQHQRMANAQASLNWANNEDYAELANDDWNESGAAKNGAARSPAPAVTPLGSGTVTLPMHDSGGLKSSLSPQAPSFDPTKLKGGNPGGASSKKGGASHGAELASEMLDFAYPSFHSGSSGGHTSRLNLLNAASMSNAPLGSDSAWLASTGRSNHSATSGSAVDNYDFNWNDSDSSFFNSVVAEASLSSALEGLNLDSRPYQSSGVAAAVTPPLHLGLSLPLSGPSSASAPVSGLSADPSTGLGHPATEA